MVVYRRKVSKRRRKRTGSKRKITKSRNKRMNRSRQMGGADPAAPGGARPAAEPAQAQPAAVPAAPPRPGAAAVQLVDAVTEATGVRDGVATLIDGQATLCREAQAKIANMMDRIKDDPGGIDLSELIGLLQGITTSIGNIQNNCGALMGALDALDTALVTSGCLDGPARV